MYDENAIRDAWKAHYERLLNVEFEWDKEHLSVEEPVLAGPSTPDNDRYSERRHK